MKRKRGSKKGKPKKALAPNANEAGLKAVSLNEEDNSGFDGLDHDEIDSGREAETPSSTGTDQPEKLGSINSGGLIDKTAGKSVYGRVKVKIRTSKTLDSQLTSSDAPTQSDTDKSSQQVGLEKLGPVSEKVEDSANSLPQMNVGFSGNPSKKTGSIKIKSSRSFVSSSISSCTNAAVMQSDRTCLKEPQLLHRDPQYNEQELNAALDVIKKVMKMDAAEPFNAPVNPVALGIPDYFDVIDTPMDFGTIRSNLETGAKYINSEAVFRDVQYIWENCHKYNNKGDYILELMKRVKKNFTKYWTTAGLYSEQRGAESIQPKDVAPPSHGKMPVKGGQLKHKTRKRHGVKRHKDDCLCAICVMMRRRQEREENAVIVEDDLETSDSPLAHEVKAEETSPVESPCGEDTSSNTDNSLDQDADADLEEKGEEVKQEDTEQLPSHEKQEEEEKVNEIAFTTQGEGEISEHLQLGDRSGELNRQPVERTESGDDIQNDTRKEISMQHEDEKVTVEQQKPKDLPEKRQKANMFEDLCCYENPLVLELCGTLFAGNNKSIWSGPHSLVHHRGSSRRSPIHAAVSMFMK